MLTVVSPLTEVVAGRCASDASLASSPGPSFECVAALEVDVETLVDLPEALLNVTF